MDLAETTQWPAAFLAITAAAAAQATLGFGFGTVALPFLLALYGAKEAVALNIVLSGVSGTVWALRIGRDASRTLTPRLVAGGLAGLVAGVVGYRLVSATALTVIALSMALLAMLLHHRRFRLPQRAEGHWAYAGGCASGFFHAAVGVGSPPLVLLLQACDLPKEAYRATATVFFAAAFPTAVLAHGLAGTYQAPLVVEALRLLPALPVGMLIGHTIFRRLPTLWFHRLVLAMLLAGTVLALIRQL